MKWLAFAALVTALGCSREPQKVVHEHVIKVEKPEMTAEEKAEEERLKPINTLNEKAVAELTRLTDQSRDIDKSFEFATAAVNLNKEIDAIKQRDGDMAAAKFFHDEVVGKTVNDIISRWYSPVTSKP